MNFEDLSPELQNKARECKTREEILALAQEEGYELSDEALEGIAGGIEWNNCPDYVRVTKPCPVKSKYVRP